MDIKKYNEKVTLTYKFRKYMFFKFMYTIIE